MYAKAEIMLMLENDILIKIKHLKSKEAEGEKTALLYVPLACSTMHF